MASRGNKLVELLDQDVDENYTHMAPEDALSRIFSIRSSASASSSATVYHQNTKDEVVSFRKIGFGQCGLVFEQANRGRAMKFARKGFADALWNDLKAHVRICEAFATYKPECRVPRVFQYVPRGNTEWWNANLPLLHHQEGGDFELPTMALISERILPLPKIARNALIDRFCPDQLKPSAISSDTNRDCLARLYLGKRRDSSRPLASNFTLRNLNLHLDQMIMMNMPVYDFTVAIGQALAIIHWSCKMDGYDIEFVLGSEPQAILVHSEPTRLSSADIEALPPHTKLDDLMGSEFTKRQTRVWVLDFNLCTLFDTGVMKQHSDALIHQLVFAFFENDPYYPLPLREGAIEGHLWEAFCGAYLQYDKLM